MNNAIETAVEEYIEGPSEQLSLEDQNIHLRAAWQDTLTDQSWTIEENEASEILGRAKGDLGRALQALHTVASDIRKRNHTVTQYLPEEIISLVHKELENLGRAQEHFNAQPKNPIKQT